MLASAARGNPPEGRFSLPELLRRYQYNITVNIVSPGLTLTEEVRGRLSLEEQERRAQQIPLRRIGRVEDTANVALFLASELGSFVTGLYIPVCGGQVME
jgi:3-oxoacyl-[acyl-carrier protein] reductase